VPFPESFEALSAAALEFDGAAVRLGATPR